MNKSKLIRSFKNVYITCINNWLNNKTILELLNNLVDENPQFRYLYNEWYDNIKIIYTIRKLNIKTYFENLTDTQFQYIINDIAYNKRNLEKNRLIDYLSNIIQYYTQLQKYQQNDLMTQLINNENIEILDLLSINALHELSYIIEELGFDNICIQNGINRINFR